MSSLSVKIVYHASDLVLVGLQRFLLALMILLGFDIDQPHVQTDKFEGISLAIVRILRNLYHLSKRMRTFLSLTIGPGVKPHPAVCKTNRLRDGMRSTPKIADASKVDINGSLLQARRSPINHCFLEPPRPRSSHLLENSTAGDISDNKQHTFVSSMSFSAIFHGLYEGVLGYVDDPDEVPMENDSVIAGNAVPINEICGEDRHSFNENVPSAIETNATYALPKLLSSDHGEEAMSVSVTSSDLQTAHDTTQDLLDDMEGDDAEEDDSEEDDAEETDVGDKDSIV